MKRLLCVLLALVSLMIFNVNVLVNAYNSIILKAEVNNSSIILKWDACNGAQNYVITKKLNGKSYNYTTTKTNYTDAKTKSTGNVTYQVFAYKNSKVISKSKLISINLDTAFALDNINDFTIKKLDYNSAYLRWNYVEGTNLYKIYRKSNNDYKLVATSDKNYFKDNTLTPTIKYYYKILPVFKNGYVNYSGSYSKPKSVTTKFNKPSSITTSEKGYNYIKFTYSKVKGATGYTLFYKSAHGKWKKYKSTKQPYIKCSNLKLNYKYYFKIRAYKKKNGKYFYSSFSSPKSYTPKLNKPKIELNAKNNYANIIIKSVKGADGYKIYTSTSQNGTYKCIATIKNNNLTYKFKPKSNKRYYIKIRAYKIQNAKKVYSSFSKRISYKKK